MSISRLFSFSGRISRGAFWLLSLLVLIPLLLYFVNEVIGLIAYLPMIWISLASSVKRWHDRGKSGAWVLISLVPIVGPIWSLVETGFLAGDPGVNQYGAPDSGSPFSDDFEIAQQPVSPM